MKDRFTRLVLVLCGLLAVAGTSRAQSGAFDDLADPRAGTDTHDSAAERRQVNDALRAPSSELAGPVDPRSYRVGPGDVLMVYLRGQLSRDIPLEVGPEGTVIVPGDGTLMVSGRTLADVCADLAGRVRRQYRNVDVDVRLGRPRTFRVYLTGQVKSPGPALANGSHRVADVLTSGMLLDGASRRGIRLIHADRTSQPCDLELFLQTGDATWNPWLRDGDVIQVPPATRFVHVEGAVGHPGRFELGQQDSLRTLLRLAGDPLPSAARNRMLVVHFAGAASPESLWLSLDDVLAGRVNPTVDDGERVYVYFVARYREQQQATVVGEVQRPGTYPITEGVTRLSELVAASQGFLTDADLSSVRVHRAGTMTGEKDPELDRLLRLSRSELTSSEFEVLRTRLASMREDYRVDWARVQADRDLDLLLRDGDVVRVDRLVSSIRVDGEVRRPGLFNYKPGQSVADCVAQAGGFTDRAWRGKIRVTRAVTGQVLPARNVHRLDPGDFVWVPEKPDRTQWDQFQVLLTALAQIATIVIAVRSLR